MYYAFVAPDIRRRTARTGTSTSSRSSSSWTVAYDDAFEYDWTRAAESSGNNNPAVRGPHVSRCRLSARAAGSFPTGCRATRRTGAPRPPAAQQSGDASGAATALRCADDAKAFGEHLRGITEQYQVAYIELDRELAIDKVCDIFTQVNSKGIRLDVFDLINALLKPKGMQLKHMWREAAPRLDFVDTERMNVYILQVMSILRQAYCSPKYLYYLLPQQEKPVRDPDGSLRKEVLVKDIAEFKALWDAAVEALREAIDLLRHPQEFGAISSAYLPYVSILPAFAALQLQATTLPPNRQLDAQRKLRHWYWASVFTNRYSGSVESTAARDFLDVTAWFAGR